jgi:hypothetical protein
VNGSYLTINLTVNVNTGYAGEYEINGGIHWIDTSQGSPPAIVEWEVAVPAFHPNRSQAGGHDGEVISFGKDGKEVSEPGKDPGRCARFLPGV